MKSYCLKNTNTKQVFKVFLTEEKLNEFLKNNPLIIECVDCVECDDAPSVTLE